jgi:hypothetical protein
VRVTAGRASRNYFEVAGFASDPSEGGAEATNVRGAGIVGRGVNGRGGAIFGLDFGSRRTAWCEGCAALECDADMMLGSRTAVRLAGGRALALATFVRSVFSLRFDDRAATDLGSAAETGAVVRRLL